MEQQNALSIFQGNTIRKVWYNNEWWFVIEDIIFALTDSKDPKGYIKDMRRRDEVISQGWRQIATPLPVPTAGGVQTINCANTERLFRLIQSIPSPKAEPFKLWLAKTGYERVQEIQNPELGQNHIRKYYELKGYPEAWIEKRIRGIAIRQELVDEWKVRNVKENQEFAILTDEISKATFGKTVKEYKEFKDINLQTANLRDHMTDWGLILTMIGDKATTDITKVKNDNDFEQCKASAKEGGEIANITKKALEKKIGRSVVSKSNFRHLKSKSNPAIT